MISISTSNQTNKTRYSNKQTYTRLSKHDRMGDTFEGVIKRLLDHYEKTGFKK